MKSKRHEKILELIRDNDIETQEQLFAAIAGKRLQHHAGHHFPGYQAAAHHQGARPERDLSLQRERKACGARVFLKLNIIFSQV